MYLDAILFLVGSIFIATALCFLIYLLCSRKRSRVYTEVLRQESEGFDILTATSTLPQNRSASGVSSHSDSGIATELADSNETESYTDTFVKPTVVSGRKDAFDPASIADSYTIEREIGGSAISRTFLVRSVKLGNPWFLKFIPSSYGELANEENILKLLNHISLPKIIDVFHRDEGTYLIETLIEGASLDNIIKSGTGFSHYILLDWFEQIAQALNYLHNMKPSPIFHLDLKPGNIMVTHDNRLVLVDFGIARRSDEDTLPAITALYAAPEQFSGRMHQKHEQLIKDRFGGILSEAGRWRVDARTDIFSLGVIMFKLSTGQIPTLKNKNSLNNAVPDELRGIIRKCLEINPAKRYQTAAHLLNDIRKVKGSKIRMARMLLTRRLASIAAAFSVVISGGSLAGGYYVYNIESAATVAARPEIVTVSLQQSSDFSVEKQMADGQTVFLESSKIRWEYSEDNVARIDGGRVSGINEGQTIIRGKYRDKEVELTVCVVRPMDGMIDISQRYETGRTIKLYAGMEKRVRADGALSVSNYISPESIAAAKDGTIYITDAGIIRRLSRGTVETVPIPVDYMSAAIIRCDGNDLYILTAPWQDGDRYYYALARLGADMQAIYVAEALYTAVEDFCFFGDFMYFIERNEGLGGVFLKTLNLYDVTDIKTLCQLPAGSSALSVADDGTAYIGNTDTGVIYAYSGGDLEFFAGLEGERAFIDGASPRFYSPQRLECRDRFLYVWDFNTLRRIETGGGIAGECITLAGMASPDYDLTLGETVSAAEDTILPHNGLMDFTVTDDGILLTDPMRGVIWGIDNTVSEGLAK